MVYIPFGVYFFITLALADGSFARLFEVLKDLFFNFREVIQLIVDNIADMQERIDRLFYKLLLENDEELLPAVCTPAVCTPAVGEASQNYRSIFKHPQGLFISFKDKGKILEILKNWPQKKIQVIVVTNGERILGLGQVEAPHTTLGHDMYEGHGATHPARSNRVTSGIETRTRLLITNLDYGVFNEDIKCLPITIDFGTNNEKMVNDEYYIGLRQHRTSGQEDAELMSELMSAVNQNYGEKVLIQFEGFGNHNAFDFLAKYSTTHLVFNDDIQGTASVVLAGLISAVKLVGGSLADHKFLFLGVGGTGTVIAELIALEISKQTNALLEETRKKVWLVDLEGLIVRSRLDSLQHFKKRWAHDHEPVYDFLDAVKSIRPTVLIGSSGARQKFTKEVVQAMSSFNDNPIILALSNLTSQSECTAEQAYTWSEGRAIFASCSPFAPVKYKGQRYVPGHSNNAYIFPGFGLGLIISGAIRVHDDMLLAASEALAEQVTQEHFDNGLIYPPFANIRKISAHIAAMVAAKAYELGLASRLPQPENLLAHAESCTYSLE